MNTAEKISADRPLRLLIVEDSEDDALLLLRELKKRGYAPLSRRIETPEAMIAALREEQWDIIISDYVLPRFNGMAALEILRQSGLDLPFIIVSGKIGEEVAVAAMKAGAHDYILKGNLTRLASAVERELRDAAVRRKKRRAEEALKRSHEELEQRVRERTEELRISKVELERLVAELERSNRDLEQFASMASHDLQEPLRMVSSFLNLLERRYGPQLDDKAREYIRYAVDGAGRMAQLIQELLVFSRIQSSPVQLSPVDMNLIFKQVVDQCRLVLEETGTRISAAELPVVRGEASLLGQLLQNLVVNAVKFRRPGNSPEVHVSVQKEDGMWIFGVKDNGIGIPPEQHEQVFQVFHRLHSRCDYEGSGIGLAVCQRIVEHHGGRIWAESVPDQGSTFLFTLPA
ncbi:MAG: ATP-binding protein [Desulfobulbaceae bacterium]|nr:ATP-binding protein [Desulfobulbaceae bacterium]